MDVEPTNFAIGQIELPNPALALKKYLCRQHNLSPEDLVIKWEVWAVSHANTATVPTESDLQALAASMQREATTTPARRKLQSSTFRPGLICG